MNHKLEGISASRWKLIRERSDRSKRFLVVFGHEGATESTYFNTLKKAKDYIVKFIRLPWILMDLERILIFDQHDRGRLVKEIDGDRLFQRYFAI